MTKLNYPAIKKALWEAWRAFVPAFTLVILTQFEAGVDLTEWKSWIFTLLSSATLAGARAVMKWVRDEYGKGDYAKAIYKLPL